MHSQVSDDSGTQVSMASGVSNPTSSSRSGSESDGYASVDSTSSGSIERSTTEQHENTFGSDSGDYAFGGNVNYNSELREVPVGEAASIGDTSC